MNKSKVLFGALSAVVVTTLVYNQTQQPEQAKKTGVAEVVKDTNKLLLSSSSDNAVTSPSDASERNEIQIGDVKTARLASSVKNQNDSQHMPSPHEQPADHRSARQPKHHGHEHVQQQRYPEDNSIIPPGEPKKPLPEQKGNS